MFCLDVAAEKAALWLDRPWLELLKEKSLHVCRSLNRSQRLYFWGMVALIVVGILHFVFAEKMLLIPILAIAMALLGAGVVSDLLLILRKLWGTLIGKGLILLTNYLATTTAFAISQQLLNEIVRYETTAVHYAVSFVAALLAPGFIFAATCLVLAIALAFGQIYMMIALNTQPFRKGTCFERLVPTATENYPMISFFGRAIAFAVVFGFLMKSGQHISPKYEKFVTDTAAKFLFNLEAVKYSRCQIPEGARSLKVNDDEIVVVKQAGDEFTFQPQKCRPILETETAKAASTGNGKSAPILGA